MDKKTRSDSNPLEWIRDTYMKKFQGGQPQPQTSRLL